MKRLLPLVLLLSAACTGAVSHRPVTTYTPAELRRLSPDHLYARFVGTPAGARVGDAVLAGPVTVGGAPISSIEIDLKPEPFGSDLCLLRSYMVDFVPVHPSRHDAGNENVPLRVISVGPVDSLSVAPGCAVLPGRRFAVVDYRLTLAGAAAVLRTLAAARDAAAGPGPLPFRLSCVDNSRERGFQCPADLRAVLAGLPLQQAFTVEPNPFPNNCERSARDEGDAVEIGNPEESEVWDVRLRRMGRENAEVALIRQLSRTHVKC